MNLFLVPERGRRNESDVAGLTRRHGLKFFYEIRGENFTERNRNDRFLLNVTVMRLTIAFFPNVIRADGYRRGYVDGRGQKV